MKILQKIYQNHVLANLTFVLVLAMGAMSYIKFPKAKDPSINFNWIQVVTAFPGASAKDIEKLITNPLEDAIRKVSDVRFASSNSREGRSSILVRFNDLPEDEFEKRITSLRREVQSKESELPIDARKPLILELTSSNAIPTAKLIVTSNSKDDNLRFHTKRIADELSRIKGVDSVQKWGLNNPELQVLFDSDKLAYYGLKPSDISDSVRAFFQDLSAGKANIKDKNWLVRWIGKDSNLEHVASVPILQSKTEIPLGQLAIVTRGEEKAKQAAAYHGKPAIMLTLTKQDSANTITLVEDIKEYINSKNSSVKNFGINIELLDDQTEVTTSALDVMQSNAVIGLVLVLLATWMFLGFKIALLVSIGIPFTLAGTFWVLYTLGHSLNISILLGIVIALGMLVDDSVVVIESIYVNLKKGLSNIEATFAALEEISAPVITSVLTTIAAFLPLMLLPGILGKFMFVIPFVVTLALAISLIEAFWMLPAHLNATKVDSLSSGKFAQQRESLIKKVKSKYTFLLIKVLRKPKTATLAILGLFISAVLIIAAGLIKVDFFASDPLRVFYVNVELPAGTPLTKTLEVTKEVESLVNESITKNQLRTIASYAGGAFTQTEPLSGEHYGQVSVSLQPMQTGFKEVDDVIADARQRLKDITEKYNISFLRLAGGPPTSSPINIKIKGDNYADINKVVTILKSQLDSQDGIYDVEDDNILNSFELILKPKYDALKRLNIPPSSLVRDLRLLVDGEVVSSFHKLNEKVNVRVKNLSNSYTRIEDLVNQTITYNQAQIPIKSLVTVETKNNLGVIRHYKFKRAVTITANIDKKLIDTVSANKIVKEYWQTIKQQHPSISLDFSGELEDIEESLNAMPRLFILGLGLIYLIVGTQFRSYFQPFIIIVTIPLAFIGVIYGLFVTQNPLSLYTLYGVVALSGISVNASIVLVTAANERKNQGLSKAFAVIYAARRRIVPILITTITTVAGLFSLATGFGGTSLLWGPMATSIVWGLMVSTVLALFVLPLMLLLSYNLQEFKFRKS